MNSDLNHLQELSQTHVLLGKDKRSGEPVWYPISELLKHVLVLGRTGIGKTNFFYWLLSQLVGKCGVWIIDRKRDHRHLIRIFPDKVLVFDMMKNFYRNQLRPVPFYDAKKWAGVLTSFYGKAFNFLNVGQGIMFQGIHKLYEEKGVYVGGKDYPNLFDLDKEIGALKPPPYSYVARSRDSLRHRLQTLLAMTGDLYNCTVGIPLEKLLDKFVVFEVDGALDDVADFMTNDLLHWLFCYRIGKGERGGALRNVVLFDECRSVFWEYDNPTAGSFAPALNMLQMLREFSVSVVAGDSTAQLHNILYGNTALKVLMGLGSGDDLFKAARSMGLSPEQAGYTYNNLGLGEAVVHDQRLGATYVLQIPKFPLE